MSGPKKHPMNRRGFLKGAAAGAAGLVAKGPEAKAQQTETARGSTGLPSARALAAETEPVSSNVEVLTADHPGSDFMIDVIKSLGFDYVAANPGSSFRALHESIINYGGNKTPELLTCCHEESSVGMAEGYAKVEGKPMGVMAHSTVGLQHAAMAIYNAYAARIPVFILLGNTIDVAERRPGIEWYHSAQDAAAMVRDYTKWDDLPISLTHFAESAVRGYKIAMTPPRGPVVLVADSDLQERAVPDVSRLHIPKLTLASPPTGDPVAVASGGGGKSPPLGRTRHSDRRGTQTLARTCRAVAGSGFRWEISIPSSAESRRRWTRSECGLNRRSRSRGLLGNGE